jgi:hypothetical protein
MKQQAHPVTEAVFAYLDSIRHEGFERFCTIGRLEIRPFQRNSYPEGWYEFSRGLACRVILPNGRVRILRLRTCPCNHHPTNPPTLDDIHVQEDCQWYALTVWVETAMRRKPGDTRKYTLCLSSLLR